MIINNKLKNMAMELRHKSKHKRKGNSMMSPKIQKLRIESGTNSDTYNTKKKRNDNDTHIAFLLYFYL